MKIMCNPLFDLLVDYVPSGIRRNGRMAQIAGFAPNWGIVTVNEIFNLWFCDNKRGVTELLADFVYVVRCCDGKKSLLCRGLFFFVTTVQMYIISKRKRNIISSNSKNHYYIGL